MCSATRPNLVLARFLGISLPLVAVNALLSQSERMPWLPHQKILENQIPFAAREWIAATTALYRAINRFGSWFDSDDLIERVAFRAMQGEWLVRSHDTPPTQVFIVESSIFFVMRLSLGTATLAD